VAKKSFKELNERARQPGQYLVAGRVIRPHGVRGDVLVEGAPELMASIKPGITVYVGDQRMPMDVADVRPHQNRYIVRLDGLASRDDAEGLRAAEIHIPTADAEELESGSYYHWQILGLKVVSDEGETLGSVTRIIVTGANDVYVVGGRDEKDLLIPAIDSVVRSVDLELGVLTVTLIPGLREVQE
jgi:16S rRNA processing protein RimM